MTRRPITAARLAAALALTLLATTALAGGKLHRLPKDYPFPRGEGSPGAVTFSHASHVDEKKPACLACHPRVFRITEAGKPADREPIQHARMEAGAACGACHGKAAFGFETCDNCHK
jgi:c(7)-type cytochrome triheme protein